MDIRKMKKGKLTVKISVQKVWLKEPTDLSKCAGCSDVIYSEMNRLWIIPKTEKLNLIGYKTDMVLCNSCCVLTE